MLLTGLRVNTWVQADALAVATFAQRLSRTDEPRIIAKPFSCD